MASRKKVSPKSANPRARTQTRVPARAVGRGDGVRAKGNPRHRRSSAQRKAAGDGPNGVRLTKEGFLFSALMQRSRMSELSTQNAEVGNGVAAAIYDTAAVLIGQLEEELRHDVTGHVVLNNTELPEQ